MSVELRLLEHCKLSNRSSVNFACGYSEDDRLFIIADTGIYIVALKGNVSSPFSTFSCKKEFMKVSDFILSANIDLDINVFHQNLERIDLYETTMASEYSASLNHAASIEPTTLSAEWSPRGIVGKTDCMLAVLTNLFSLELYVKYLDENELICYTMICNVSEEIINLEKKKWVCADRFSNALKLTEIKKRIVTVTPTAFTWSHLYKNSNQETCALFVGHMNGDITVWKIHLRPANSKKYSELYFLGRYSTCLQKITTMYWHQTTEFGGGLCFADSDGKMSVLHVSDLDKEEVSMDKELAFWTEADKVLIDRITVMIYDNFTYIIMIKQSFLIIYGIADSGNVFDQKVCQVGNYYITGIHHMGNIILVLTMSGVFKQYILSVKQDKILLEEKVIPLKVDLSRYRTHGFFFSKNTVLFGLVTYPCQLRSFAKSKTYINIFLYHNTMLNPFEILWYNNSSSLQDYWDCFEVLRLICLKDKHFPWLELPPDLNYDNLTLLQLKTLRWLAKLSETVFSIVPVIKNYNIKPYIILHYLVEIKLVVQRINSLLNLRNSGKYLSVFQMRSIDVQIFFLKEMVIKNILAKANVGKNFISEIRHVISIANELRYPQMVQCIWCGEKIIGPLCLPPHADSRCCISMMPIFLVPAYKCPFCNVLAHKEIEKEHDVIFCPYCDIPMEARVVNENIIKNFEGYMKEPNKDYRVVGEEVKSVCFDDCLKDDTSFSDIEENTSDYVILSDSEDETCETANKLRTLYAQMSNMSLEEIVKFDVAGHEESVKDSDTSEAGPSRKVTKLDS